MARFRILAFSMVIGAFALTVGLFKFGRNWGGWSYRDGAWGCALMSATVCLIAWRRKEAPPAITTALVLGASLIPALAAID